MAVSAPAVARSDPPALDPFEGPLALGEWWTEADLAELDVLMFELVRGVSEHRPRCASCAKDEGPCPHIGNAIQAVLDWRAHRDLASRAEWLREQRDRLDAT